MSWYEAIGINRAPYDGYVDPINGVTYHKGSFVPFYIPRNLMPQINEDSYVDLMIFAASSGMHVTIRSVNPNSIKPHQRVNWTPGKPIPTDVVNIPIIISNDGYIIDGHHRWFINSKNNNQIIAIILDLPFDKAIPFVFNFPSTYTVEGDS